MVKRKRSKCHGNSCKRNKSRLSLAILFQKQSQIEKQKIVVKCERHLLNTLEKLRKTAFSCENSRFSVVRVGRLELPASSSQTGPTAISAVPLRWCSHLPCAVMQWLQGVPNSCPALSGSAFYVVPCRIVGVTVGQHSGYY